MLWILQIVKHGTTKRPEKQRFVTIFLAMMTVRHIKEPSTTPLINFCSIAYEKMSGMPIQKSFAGDTRSH
ncbi:hypothetical protein [Paenibacillus wynnii]|uniref:hypothetical protein n=1 Tax=Paenibacillus wynnii TaxID=268407 RepID=UPI00278F44C2|nr:hypothetical protein [Paenibacillus wynnii]MDQ0195360.1 hypothetical protein [Paenibacillus wynnii]